MKPGRKGWMIECHVCARELAVGPSQAPLRCGDEFEFDPLICPTCDAPLRFSPIPLDAGGAISFILGLFGDVGMSSGVGGAQNMLRRRGRSEHEFDELYEMLANVQLDGYLATMESRLNLNRESGRREQKRIARLRAEREVGLLNLRLNSMIAQAKAELVAEHERHLTILEFRRNRGLL